MKGLIRALAFTGIIAVAAAAGTKQANAQVGFGVRVAPPVYYNTYQPACPGVGFIWAPAYYAGSSWIPGRWIHREDYAYAHRDYRFDHHDFDRREVDRGRRYR